jgi:FkbM family methyltransferase
MSSIFETVSNHRKTLSGFAGLRDQALYIYGRLLRRCSWSLPGRHSIAQVRLRGQSNPFHLRLASTDWLVLEEIFQRHEYACVREAVKEAGWIVDLGANVGYSLRYWQTLFPKARVIAMEPEADNCLVCSRNILSAGLQGQVKLLQAAAAPSRSRMRLMDVGKGEWAYRTEEADDASGDRSVDALPLTEILADHAKDQIIDLLKCDIEGAEKELFADCRAWIGRVDAIVIELHAPYTLADLLAALKKAGADFEIVSHMNRKSCPVVMLRRSKSLH